MTTGKAAGLGGALLSLLAITLAVGPASANGIREDRPPPPPPPKIPCCYVERQLEYDTALRDAWLCTLAQGAEGSAAGKIRKSRGSGGGEAVSADRSCWNAAFDSRCAGRIYHSYRGIPPVRGPHDLLNRLNREIAWLEVQREDCDSAPSPDHPLLPYCRHYCDAPELYGHAGGGPPGPGEPSGDRPGRAPAE